MSELEKLKHDLAKEEAKLSIIELRIKMLKEKIKEKKEG